MLTKKVKRNKGAGDVDKMQVESLKDYLVENKDELITSIMQGKYRPNPVRRVEISKENGSKRQLGIPTVVDRVIQQAIGQVLNCSMSQPFHRTVMGLDQGGMPTKHSRSAKSTSQMAIATQLTWTWKSSSTK